MKYFYKGRRLSEVLLEKNLEQKMVYKRIWKGWTVEEAVDIPKNTPCPERQQKPIFFKEDIENFIESEIKDCYEDLAENKKINFKLRALEATRFLLELDKTLKFYDIYRPLKIAFLKEGWR